MREDRNMGASAFMESKEFPDIGADSLLDHVVPKFGSVGADYGLNFLVGFAQSLTVGRRKVWKDLLR